VVTEYSQRSGLKNHFDPLGFGPQSACRIVASSIPSCPPPRAMTIGNAEKSLSQERDRWFESVFLQQRV
jgi:hypothetical protein